MKHTSPLVLRRERRERREEFLHKRVIVIVPYSSHKRRDGRHASICHAPLCVLRVYLRYVAICPSLHFATLSSSRSVVLSCGIVPSHIPNLTTYGLPIFLPIDHTKSHVASPPFQAPTRQSKTKVESREQFPIRNPISHCASTPPCRFSHLPSQVFSADLVYFCVKRSPAPNLQTKSHVAPPRHVSRHVNRQLFPRATYFAPCHKSFAEAFVITTSQ